MNIKVIKLMSPSCRKAGERAPGEVPACSRRVRPGECESASDIRRLVVSAILFCCLGALSAQAAESPEVATLKAAGANVYQIKKEDGGGTGVTFGNFALDDQGWRALESLPNLKTFTVFGSGKAFGDEQMTRVCQIKTLESIFVNGYGGTERGLAALVNLPNLHHFGADHSPFTGTGLAALKNSPNFSSVRFGGCPFDDEGMKALGELTQLKEANISHVRITSAGFPNFGKLVNLEKLTISPNFDPYYVGADFVYLSGLKNLKALIVSEMALPYEDGLEHLKGLNLQRLELHDCRVSDADLQRLKSDLPNTTIERIYSIDEKYQHWDAEVKKRKSQSASH